MLFSSRRTPTPPSATLPVLRLGLSALLLSGCFIGDAADGLECELDADCGLGVVCAADPAASGAKCCGGSCLGVGNTTGPNSTSTVTESQSSSEGSTTTVADLCGNGAVDPGEECDPEDPDTEPCGDGCELLCGNRAVDEGEDCDDDNPFCMDCKYLSACGNGVFDDGEICEVWTGTASLETCRENCAELVVFDWPGAETSSNAFCTDRGDCDEAWALDSNMRWGSGEYFHDAVGDRDPNPDPSMWPESVLRTRVFSLPALQEGDLVRVELIHAYDLDSQTDPSNYVDYVELSLEPENGAVPPRNIELDNPVDISCSGVVRTDCVSKDVAGTYCGAEDPLRRSARSFSSGGNFSTYGFDVAAEDIPAGGQRLRFKVRYDCGTFNNGTGMPPRPPPAWTIESVVVVVARPNAG